jgi:hypothetical protein
MLFKNKYSTILFFFCFGFLKINTMNKANQPIVEPDYKKLNDLSSNTYELLNKILENPKELNTESNEFFKFQKNLENFIREPHYLINFSPIWDGLIDLIKTDNNKKLLKIYYYGVNAKNHNFMGLLKLIPNLLSKDKQDLNDKLKDDDSLNDKILLSKLSNLLFKYHKNKEEHIFPYEYIIDQLKELFKSQSTFIQDIINQKIYDPKKEESLEKSPNNWSDAVSEIKSPNNWSDAVSEIMKPKIETIPKDFAADKIFTTNTKYIKYIPYQSLLENKLYKNNYIKIGFKYLYITGFLDENFNVINNKYDKAKNCSDKNHIIKDHCISIVLFGNDHKNGNKDSTELRLADGDIKSNLNQFITKSEKLFSDNNKSKKL